MKTKQFITAVLISCGIMVFGVTQAYAQATSAGPQTQEVVQPGTVTIDFIGFQSGNVQMNIIHDGQREYFLGTTAGNIGHFIAESDSFDIEIVDISWWTTPSFKYLSGSANLQIEKISEYKYHVTGFRLSESGANIVLVFGN